MNHNPIITLTTDFGFKDPFVGIMKGVILNINPSANIVDITHNITPQNIMEASVTIGMGFNYFPHRTIHVVVVDPGVGSVRKPIIVLTDYYCFVGPDNGVFSQIYSLQHEILMVIHITSDHYFTKKGSTFHGKEIFAPVAAWLSRGIEVMKFGTLITDYVNTPIPSPTMPEKNVVEGEVIYIDRFGNAITNINTQQIENLYKNNPQGMLKVIGKGKEMPMKNHYSDAEDKRLYSLINSFSCLELFVYKGSASSDFGIAIGEKVRVVSA